jgi:hypothetical protein
MLFLSNLHIIFCSKKRHIVKPVNNICTTLTEQSHEKVDERFDFANKSVLLLTSAPHRIPI